MVDDSKAMWGVDCDIDRAELGNESLKLRMMDSK